MGPQSNSESSAKKEPRAQVQVNTINTPSLVSTLAQAVMPRCTNLLQSSIPVAVGRLSLRVSPAPL